MQTTYILKADELNNDFLQSVKVLFHGKVIEIAVSDSEPQQEEQLSALTRKAGALAGRIKISDDFTTIENILRQQGIDFLPIRTPNLLHLLNLPFHHREPFDRLHIAQAQAEQLTLVSDDGMFAAYSVSLLDR